jgi:hypothetical protein
VIKEPTFIRGATLTRHSILPVLILIKIPLTVSDRDLEVASGIEAWPRFMHFVQKTSNKAQL